MAEDDGLAMAVVLFAVEGQGALEPRKSFAPALLRVRLSSLGEHLIGGLRAWCGLGLSRRNRGGQREEPGKDKRYGYGALKHVWSARSGRSNSVPPR